MSMVSENSQQVNHSSKAWGSSHLPRASHRSLPTEGLLPGGGEFESCDAAHREAAELGSAQLTPCTFRDPQGGHLQERLQNMLAPPRI